MIHTATEWTEALSDDPALAVLRDKLATSTSADSRAALGAASNNIRERFLDGESVVTLVHARSAVVDAVLTHLWQQYAQDCVATAALVAVGGYGRAELHPYSDVDILLLLPKSCPQTTNRNWAILSPRSGTSASRSVTAYERSSNAVLRRKLT